MGQIENFDVELNEIDIDGAAYIVPVDENFRKLKAAAEALKAGVESSSPDNHTHNPEDVGAAPAEHSHTAKDVGAFPAIQGKTLQENVGDISDKLFSHWWKKKKLEQVISVDTTKRSLSVLNALDSPSAVFTAYYADSFSSTVNPDGSVTCTLINPEAVTFSYNDYTNATVLRGKYVVVNDGVNDTCWYIDEASRVEPTIMSKYYVFFDAYEASIEETYIDYGYASSNSADTYSQGQNNDGYYYEYLGIPFENARESVKIERLSYIGTGTYGEENPCSLTLPENAQLVICTTLDHSVLGSGSWTPSDYQDDYYNIVDLSELDENYRQWAGFGHMTGTYLGYGKKVGNTLYWYNTKGASNQYNMSSTRYVFLVFC